MNKTSAIGLVLAAGALCSVASAQDVVRGGLATTEAIRGDEPVKVLQVGGRVSVGGPDLVQQLPIYSNGIDQTGGYYAFGTTAPAQILDDIYFNRGPGAGPGPGLSGSSLLQQAVVGIVSTGASFDPIDVEFRWWNNFVPGAATPITVVNTNLGGSVRQTIQAPQPNGWEVNSVYFIELDLTTLPGGGIATTTEFGAAEVIIYDGPLPSTTLNESFEIAFHEDYPQVGDSVNRFYRDVNGNGLYESNEARVTTGNPRPQSNIVLELLATKDAGSCCMPDGTCIMATAQSCARVSGVYNGSGDCSTATCTQPGACIIGTACAVLSSAQCTAANGVYRGNGTDCFSDTCRQGSGTILLHDNGPVSTGATLTNGTAAPAGTTWSELQGVTGCSNTTFGASSGSNGPFRIGDDFMVPTGETWTLQQMETWAYQTGSSTTVSPFADGSFNINIWSGPPWDLNSMLLYQGFGSTSTFSGIYRTAFNTVGTTRPLFKITHEISPALQLTAGHYYIEWQTAATNGGAHFSPYRATKGTRGTLVSNGIQQLDNGDWQGVQDTGNPVNCGAGMFAQEFPFVIRGTLQGSAGGCTQACYANCDQSTQNPVLNVADFSCFLTRFAANDPYANCDGSTQQPVLNVADFSCFLTKFAAGCP